MFIVRKATSSDINGILAVLQDNLIADFNKSDGKQLAEKGFLLSSFTAEDLINALVDDKNHLLVVAVENDKIVGYCFEYDLQHAQPAWLLLAHQEKNIPAETKSILSSPKVLYHRQIAKLRNQKGVGQALLNFVINEATLRKYHYIICQIALEPLRNNASIYLHEKLGFELAAKLQQENVLFGLYLKKL